VIGGFEIIKGTRFNDTLTGGETGAGGGVNFRLHGRRGNDVLTGSTSNDILKGAAGNDVLRGAGGDDTLSGGKGNDEGFGGRGTDICRRVEVLHSCEIV